MQKAEGHQIRGFQFLRGHMFCRCRLDNLAVCLLFCWQNSQFFWAALVLSCQRRMQNVVTKSYLLYDVFDTTFQLGFCSINLLTSQ